MIAMGMSRVTAAVQQIPLMTHNWVSIGSVELKRFSRAKLIKDLDLFLRGFLYPKNEFQFA
jgi:hypothetical protein